MIDERTLRWEIMNAGGWEYLLPYAERRRWLCLDASGGATTLLLAGLCHELHVVPPDCAASAQIDEKLRAQGVANARLARNGEFPDSSAHVSGGFDGFILHDLRGVLSRRAVEQALRAGAQSVSRDGFIYAALRNRYGYTRLQREWSEIRQRGTGAYFSACAVRRLVDRGRETTMYPLICSEDGRITEMVPPGGYISSKNPSLPKEYLRRWLLGQHGARRWSSGFALVAAGDRKARSGLACALDTLEAHGCLKVSDEPEEMVKRYHVLNGGKAIVSVGETPGRYGSHIVVLVRSPEFTARRRREGQLLRRLAALPTSIASRIPCFYYEEEAGAAHVFVLEEFPGITLDAPVAGFRSTMRDAAHFLMQLHSATRRTLLLTAELFRQIFGSSLEAARRRYPPLVSVLDRLEAALRGRLESVALPVVWMHGDFKIENIVVDERSHRLLGVIDWELSEPEGLPLLDLWYLLLYKRRSPHGDDFLTGALDILPPREFAGEEAALCADYMRALGIPPSLVPALAGALIVHHAARRMEYDPNDAGSMTSLHMLLEKAEAWIEAETHPAHGMRKATRDA
jgi:aminoglycoside phosphotransferase (APT) family kinase protein